MVPKNIRIAFAAQRDQRKFKHVLLFTRCRFALFKWLAKHERNRSQEAKEAT